MKRRNPIFPGGVLGVAMVVDHQIENVVVIAADKMAIVQAQQELNHAMRIGSAVDIIANEKQLAFWIDLLHLSDQCHQRPQHSVNIANDPSHGSAPRYRRFRPARTAEPFVLGTLAERCIDR